MRGGRDILAVAVVAIPLVVLLVGGADAQSPTNSPSGLTIGSCFLYGLFGGVAIELVQWFGMRKDLYHGAPDWSKSWLYWLVTALMVIAGGGLAVAYAESGVQLTTILAINLGASAPLLLSRFGAAVPRIEPGSVD